MNPAVTCNSLVNLRKTACGTHSWFHWHKPTIAGNVVLFVLVGQPLQHQLSIGKAGLYRFKPKKLRTELCRCVNIASAPYGMLVPPTTAFIITPSYFWWNLSRGVVFRWPL